MQNATEPFKESAMRYEARQALGRMWLLGLICYGLMFFDSDPAMPWIVLTLAAGSFVAMAADQLQYEDHERFRAGDFWRSVAIFSLSAAPWLALPAAWPTFPNDLGFRLWLPFLLLSGPVAYALATLNRPFRTATPRGRLLKAAVLVLVAGGAAFAGGLVWRLWRPAPWVGAGLAAPSLIACLWLARRLWIQPAERRPWPRIIPEAPAPAPPLASAHSGGA